MTTRSEVTAIYIATFDRSPDSAGLDYWAAKIDVDGWTIEMVAESFFDQDVTQRKYPDIMPNGTFINEVYNNVLDREPDQEGYNYWLEQLDSGALARNDFIIAVVTAVYAPDGDANDLALLSNKVEVGEYFADSGRDDLGHAASSLVGVTGDDSTVVTAKSSIDEMPIGGDSSDSRSDVSAIYIATFDRAPDSSGLDYWTAKIDVDDWTIEMVAQSFFEQPETQMKYPETMSNEDFVTEVYNNVLDRAPDEPGFKFWVDLLDSSAVARNEYIVALVNAVMDPAGNQDDFALLSNKVEVGEYFADTDREHLSDAELSLTGVTGDYATVVAAKASINEMPDFYLTTGVDDISGTNGDDIVMGIDVDDLLTDTLTDGDSFNGYGGIDTLKIDSDTVDLTLTKIQLTDVEQLEVLSAKDGWDSVDIADHDFDQVTLDVGGKISGGLNTANINASTAITLANIKADNEVNIITFNADDYSFTGYTNVTVSDVDLSGGNESFEVSATFNAADTINTAVNLVDFNDDKQGKGGTYEHKLDAGTAMGVAINATFNIEDLITDDAFDVGLFVDQAGGSINNITVNLTNTNNVDVSLEFDNLGNGTSVEDVVTVNLNGVGNSNNEAYFYTTDAETFNVNVLSNSELEDIGNFYNNDGSAMGNVVVNLNATDDLTVGFWNFSDTPGDNTSFNITGSGNVMIDELDDGSSNVTVDGSTATGDITLNSMAEEVVSVTTGTGNDSITVSSNETSVSTNGGNDFVDTNSNDFSLIGSATLYGGRGYDTIAIDDANHFDLTERNIRYFERLDISSGKGVYDISLASGMRDVIASEGIDQSIIIDKTTSRTTVTLNAFDSDGKTITLMQRDGTGVKDILTLGLNAIDENDDQSIDGETDAIIIAAEYETLKLTSNAVTASEESSPSAGDFLLPVDYTNTVDLDIADTTDFLIEGNAQLSVMLTDASALAVVDASDNTGGVDIDLSSAGTTGISFQGSGGVDTVTVSDHDFNIIQGNGGADSIGLADGIDAVRYVRATDSQLILTDTEMSGFDVITDFTNGGSDHIQLFAQLNLGPNESRFALIQKGDIGGNTPADMQEFIGDGVDFFAGIRVDRATAFADDGTNGYLFVDGNNDGDFIAADDVVIQLAGVMELSINDIQFG